MKATAFPTWLRAWSAQREPRGKTPTDVWWHTIVSPTGKEKTGYATQKPLGILERIVWVHSNAGETVLDFFAGSGTTWPQISPGRRECKRDQRDEQETRSLSRPVEPVRTKWPVYRHFGTSPSDKQMTITSPDPDIISPARL